MISMQMLLINRLLEWLAIVSVPGAEPVALFQGLNHSLVAVLGSESYRPRVSCSDSGVLFGAHAQTLGCSLGLIPRFGGALYSLLLKKAFLIISVSTPSPPSFASVKSYATFNNSYRLSLSRLLEGSAHLLHSTLPTCLFSSTLS